ncbi:MAG: hypothetical protein E6J29_02300 [Chloroflexi bacterium]|nr:MAG: hypothetical protein E6J29_02300 [Chloroflexota bacterium]TMD53792.1 MAG: hypothetical protein E6I85_07630 [Chloroflexota bacterium]
MRTRTIDLHGHDVLTAVDLAEDRVREAYSNGYEAVELLHGAGDVTEPVETGRGRIKWALRRLVEGGGLDGYIDRRRTWLKAGSIVLYLRRNPKARPERWSPDPPRTHRR